MILISCCSGDGAPEHGERIVAGRSVAQWQSLMSRLELHDPASRAHVPGLIELMDDNDVPWVTRRQAALTLGRLGPLARDAIPRVAAHLEEVSPDDPETSPQRWALRSLALFGREARSAAPQLIRILQDDQSSTVAKLSCLEALSQIGSAAPESIPALWEALEERLVEHPSRDDQELALGAAEALGMVGPEAATAVPVLMRAAQRKEETLRCEAIRAIGKIGPAARDAQPLLLDAMLDDDAPLIQDAATVSLGQTGPAAWPEVEALLESDETDVRRRAASAVASWKPLAKTILPALEPLLQDADTHVRLAAAKSWRSLSGKHDRVWSLLAELLTDPERDVRRGASLELQAIAAKDAISDEQLQQLEADHRPTVRLEAVRLKRLRDKLRSARSRTTSPAE